MNCDLALELLPCYMDGELDAVNAQEIERHLSDCENCRQAAQAGRDLSHSIRAEYPHEQLPGTLRDRVTRTALGRPAPALPAWTYAFAAGLAAGIALMWVLLRPVTLPNALPEQLVASHIRSLMATNLVDIASSDRHMVKPWFQGKLSFSPEVPDLTAQGFPLVGGRAEFLAGKPAAALVYRRRRHVLNVFVTPAASHPAEDFDRQGFHSRRFALDGLDYWVVSDVSPADIESFKRLFVAAAGEKRRH